MVKLIYNGVMAKGILRGKGIAIPVVKGETYDIPESFVDKLLKVENGRKLKLKKKKSIMVITNGRF